MTEVLEETKASARRGRAPESDEATESGRTTLWRWLVFGVVVVAVVSCLALSLVLSGAQEDVLSTELVAGDGIPVTLYLPGEPTEDGALPPPPAEADRPPVVVLAHGFSGDRAMVSTLARRMAAAGYAVASLDFRGHGTNLNAFGSGSGRGLREDFAAVLDLMEESAYVDAERVAVMGHSMGAGAALGFARHDPRPDAVVAVSGAWPGAGPETPDDVLFLLASDDPGYLKDSVSYASDGLPATVSQKEVTIEGTDHLTILWSEQAAEETIVWLDDTFGVERSGTPSLSDPRLGLSALYVLAALVVMGAAGWVGARLAPAGAVPAEDQGWAGAGITASALAAAILLTVPIATLATPSSLVPLAGAGALVGSQMILGFWLLGIRTAARSEGAPAWTAVLGGTPVGWDSVGRAVLPAAVVALIVTLALAPAGVVFHNLMPTLVRLGLGVLTALLLAPFAFGFNLLVRQGPPLRAAISAVAGRILVLLGLVIGASTGILDDFILLMAPVIAATWIFLEIIAIVAYTSRRNVVLIAVVESLLSGILIATIMPVSI